MILRPVTKDETVSLPTKTVSPNGQGWISAPAPDAGIVVVFNDSEVITGGAFIEIDRLKRMLAEIERKQNEKEQENNGE